MVRLHVFIKPSIPYKLYAGSVDVNAFANRLWGDIWFNEETRKFTRKPADSEANRTFVHFILEPLYKLYSHVLSEETDSLKETLATLGIQLKPIMYKWYLFEHHVREAFFLSNNTQKLEW